MTTSNAKLKPNAAQRWMLSILESARAQVDIAVRAPKAGDRARALRRLERALAALSDKPK